MVSRNDQPPWVWRTGSIAILALGLLAGCRSAGEFTDGLGPKGWRANLWGPKGHAARASGQLPEIPYNDDMIAWENFAERHLQTGDVLFRQADARVAMRLIRFSDLASSISNSRFTHTGIFVWENGQPMVYDTSMCGVRRQRFGIWCLDNVGHVGFARPKPEYAPQIPTVVAFCRDVYRKQVPFDLKLKLGDDHFYCAEMTARAFESAGMPLSQPSRMNELPHFQKHAGLFAIANSSISFLGLS